MASPSSSSPVLDARILNARRVLEQRRAALLTDIRRDIRDTCAGGETVQPDDAMDVLDTGAIMLQSGIHFSLMHLKAEALAAMDEALARIAAGCYGLCESCGGNISEGRLRAIPFALRCKECEERKEEAERARSHAKTLARRLTEEEREAL